MKEDIKRLWEYLNDAFEEDEVKDATDEFSFESEKMSDESLDNMSDENLRSLFFDMAYMAVNGLFGGDFHTWNEVLESFGFDDETIDLLNY